MSTVSTQKIEAVVKKDASWALGALKQFSENRCAAMAASIAFYSAFSLAPTLVMVIAVAGWIFGPEAARGQLFHQVNGLIGDQAASGVQSIVENAHRSSGTGIAAIISFVLLAVGASATFSSLNTALNIVWPMAGDARSSIMTMVRVRLVSFGLVLGVAFLLIVSLVLDTAIQAVGMWLWANSPFVIVGDIVQLVAGLAILTVAFGALLKFLPDAPVQWRDALVGGLVAALLFSAGKKLFALYLTHAGTAARSARRARSPCCSCGCISPPPCCCSARNSRRRARGCTIRAARGASRTTAACRRAAARRSARCWRHRPAPRCPSRPPRQRR